MKIKVFKVVILVLLPYVLFSSMETKSNITYLWWEDVLGYIAVTLLYFGYAHWCYYFIFKQND